MEKIQNKGDRHIELKRLHCQISKFDLNWDATDVSVKLDPSAYFVNFVHYYIKKIA